MARSTTRPGPAAARWLAGERNADGPPPEEAGTATAAGALRVAAHTQRVKLGTGIIILPQRNPLVLAKELASVDVVSRGRLILGL